MPFILIFVAAIAIVILKIFIVGSLVVSGIKSISDSCEEIYPIESIGLSGDWFCPIKK